jgi:hypothetical protein
MRFRVLSRLPLFYMMFLLISLPLYGQLYTGSISGSVADPSGAVVRGAHVVAKDVEKGFAFAGTTDSAGHYVLRNVPPATYNVTAEAPGFEKQRKDGVVITVNLNATVDFALTVGSTSQTIEVQATGVELQTQDAVTGQVIDRRAINDLPLVGRDVLQLTFLAPGIVPVAEASRNDEGFTGVNFNSNGGRNGTADLLMDGTSISNIEQNGGTNNGGFHLGIQSPADQLQRGIRLCRWHRDQCRDPLRHEPISRQPP